MYKGKPGADAFLTRVVLEGSNPYGSHWKDQVSGLAMPPTRWPSRKPTPRSW
jgi:cytochrome c